MRNSLCLFFEIPESEHFPAAASSVLSSPGWLSTAGSGFPVCFAEQRLPLQRWIPPDHYLPCSQSQLWIYEPAHQFGEPEKMITTEKLRCWVDGSEAQMTKLNLHRCATKYDKTGYILTVLS